MDYSKFFMFSSEVVKTCADNKWIKIITSDNVHGPTYDWVKASSIPNYKLLKAGDLIEYSYLYKDKPVVRVINGISYKCETTIF